MAKQQKPRLGRANQARRNAEAKAVNEMLVERSRSNASGTHANKRDKRARTRNASERKALRDFDS